MSRKHLLVAAVLILAGCGGGKKNNGPTNPPPPPPPPPVNPTVTSVTVSSPQGPLASLGASLTLTAEVRLSNGSIGTQVPTWTSSSPNVATVANGVVTAVGNGQTTITAAVGTVTGAATVTVAQVVTSIRLLPSDTVIKSAATLRGTALDSRNNPVAGAPVTWESLTPNIVGVNTTGTLTPLSTGVARVKFTSGTFSSTAIVRTIWNVTQLSTLFPLFEYSASSGQRRAISDVSQAHADARAVVMGQAWPFLSSLLPSGGTNNTDMYFTTWSQIWTEFIPFCGGQFLTNQINWTTCLTPHRQHFFITPGQTPDDYPPVVRFLSLQFFVASYFDGNAFPWFREGFGYWLSGGSFTAAGLTGKINPGVTNDFRTGDQQNLLAPLDTLMRLNNAQFFENLPQRTPVAVRAAQMAMLVSYLESIPGAAVCKILQSIRNAPGNGRTNAQTMQLMQTATAKTIAELETGYLAHARAITGGTASVATVVPVTCP